MVTFTFKRARRTKLPGIAQLRDYSVPMRVGSAEGASALLLAARV